MNVKELINILQKEDPQSTVYIDISTDYEEHTEALKIVKGEGDSVWGRFTRKADGKDVEIVGR